MTNNAVMSGGDEIDNCSSVTLIVKNTGRGLKSVQYNDSDQH
jgi:hypothetical protein